MAQNVTINIQNNYYVQAPSPKSNMKAFGWGVATGSAGGILLYLLNKKCSKIRNRIAPITKCVNKLFGDDDLRNELNNAMLSAKRNNCANTNPSANVSHSESIIINTNHSESNRSDNTNITEEKVNNNQQQPQSKDDSFSDEQAKCSEMVESSNGKVISSPVQEKNADLGEQYAADMKCSPAEEQKKSVSFQQKNKRKTEKKVARGTILYNPLLLPNLIRGFEVDLQQTALKVLYGLCQNRLFQCSEDCFLYWFGGESDTPKKAYQRISWQKSKLTLQYFMKQLYNERFDKGQWEMVANVFKIRGKTIPVGDLGKNTSNVGDKDKQMIDDLIKQFKKEVKKIAPSSIK